jgi:hypothetical protein
MEGSRKFNELLAQNGGSKLDMDEDLLFSFEDKPKKVYYASVYGSKFYKIPKGFCTSQPVYRDFCREVAGMMPKKRTGADWDDYIRRRLAEATVQETLPGMEEGVVVGHAIFSVVARFLKRVCDYDNPDRSFDVSRGDPVFFETRPEGPGYKEMFFRVNYLMDHITEMQSLAQFERKIDREEVCQWLVMNGRKPYPATGTSPRRLRSTYPIPHFLYLKWRMEDIRIDEEEEG